MNRSKYFVRYAFVLFVTFLLPALAHAQGWVARHGLSPASYQAEFDKQAKAGFRLIEVNGYTANGQERYAALWEKVVGPAMVAHHGMNAATYQTKFNEYTAAGYRLTHISGYGVGSEAKFAAIWEKRTGAQWVARHNLNAAQYQAAFDDYKKQGFRLRKVSGYVVNNVELFAAIWEKGSGEWAARHNQTAAQFQSTFDSMNAQGFVLTDVSGYTKGSTNLYAGIWEKTSSPLRYVRHGIADNNYQHVFDNTYYQGYKPIHVQGFASGSGAKFNGIWTNTNFSGADMAKLDNAVNKYMKDQSVTGLSVAVTKGGRLVLAKGYGLSNVANNIEMSPNDSLRIWSISKSVTSVGIMTLLTGRPNLLDEKVFGPGSVLGATYPTPKGREGLNNFTVRQLLNMTSGLRTCNGEAVFNDPNGTVATAMSTLMNASDLITSAPNSMYIYSNTNFFFLARIIEKVSGKPYETYIREKVLTPAGIGNQMYVGLKTGESKAGEATYTPQRKPNMQLFGGFGGWVARPMDLLKLLRVVDGNPAPGDILSASVHTTMTTGTSLNTGYALGWGVSGNTQNHNGCFDGGRSFLVEVNGDLSYSVIINKTPADDGCGWKMKAALDPVIPSISNFPSYDLFQ
jgi:CubicO group peptidase (beta-lactamase class C family)